MTDTGLVRAKQVLTSRKSAIDFRKIPTILLHQRFLILGISCIVISVASLMTLKIKPTYQSSMQILVHANLYEGENINDVQTELELQPKSIAVDYTPQLKLILGSKLIQKALIALKSEYQDLTADRIKEALKIQKLEAATGSDRIFGQVFKLSFQDRDPLKAQKVLQALKTAYEEYNIQQQKQRLNQALTFVNDRLPHLKQQVKQAETKLEKFRKQHNVLDPQVQGKILFQSLADTQKQLQSTRALLQEAQARYNKLQQEATASAQKTQASFRLNQSPRYQTLLEEIQKTDLALAKERQRYTDNSPIVQKLNQQRQTQAELMRQEIRRSLANKAEKPQSEQEKLAGVDQKLAQQLIEAQATIEGLRANEKSLAQSEQQIRVELKKYPALISEYNRLLPEVEVNHKKLEQMTQAQQSLALKISQTGFDLQILEEPQKGTYFGNTRFFFLIGAIVMAPILSTAAALIWGFSHGVIHSPKELQTLTNLKLLATVPKLQAPSQLKKLMRRSFQGRRNSNSFKAAAFPIDEKPLPVYASWPFHQTLDMAYQNIQILESSFAYKSLMLTSAVPGEGKTTLALGLAVSAARMHRRVLLVDANLQQPTMHKILNLNNDWGLSLLLVDDTSTSQDYIQPIHPSIDVLTAGSKTEDPVKLLSSRRMKELLHSFEQNYDLVLIDTPAILSMVDARILATFCNSIVMVAQIGKVTQTELIQATDILSQVNLIGIIANLASHAHA